MKILAILFFTFLFFAGCAHDENIGGRTVKNYGLFNEEDKDSTAKYHISQGNVVLSIIFSETIIVPVVLVGWHLYAPTK